MEPYLVQAVKKISISPLQRAGGDSIGLSSIVIVYSNGIQNINRQIFQEENVTKYNKRVKSYSETICSMARNIVTSHRH